MDIPENCGNAAIDSEDGETCDDGNNVDGDGCSAACTSEAAPRVDVSVDKPTVSTELGTTQMITATVTGGDGFAGDVGVAVSVVDGLGAPLPGWLATVQPAVVTLGLNGSGTAVVTLSIPSENQGLLGNVKITTTSSATEGTREITSAVTALNQVSFTITSNGGQCVYSSPAPVNVTEGTTVRIVNGGDIVMTVHSDGGSYGVAHQNVGIDMPPNEAYVQTVGTGVADGADFQWYCHAPGPNLGAGGNPKILVVPAATL